MGLESLLVRNKRTILDKWFNFLSATYPADTAEFLRRTGDPFSNPIGSSARSGLEAIFDELLGGMDPRPLSDFLDPIIRIRAVQSFTPSQAVGFIFSLKTAIRDVLGEAALSQPLFSELQEFELRIDELALLGFNLYMECREKLFQLKEEEMKTRAILLLAEAGAIHGKPGPKSGNPKS